MKRLLALLAVAALAVSGTALASETTGTIDAG